MQWKVLNYIHIYKILKLATCTCTPCCYFYTIISELTVNVENENKNVSNSCYHIIVILFQVIPMLPRILCEELCSLNPDQDRLTFSVVWNMSETGEVILNG